jgi:hypothetical protein
LAGIDRLGASFSVADGYANSTFEPGRYDGGTATRVLAFDVPSQIWRYASPPQSVP